MKPIQKDFIIEAARATLRLANEWRDTLSYTAGTLVAGYLLIQGNNPWLWMFPTVVCTRESVRLVTWGFYSEPKIVGDHSKPVDGTKNMAAAAIVANCATIGGDIANAITHFAPPSPFTVLSMVGAAALVALLSYTGVGLRDIPTLYFDKETGMWDWPRKDKGNGPTQTQKFKDGAVEWGRQLTAAIARPAFGSVRALLAAMPR